MGGMGHLLGAEESNTNTEEVKPGANQQQEDNQSSCYNNNDSIKNKVIIKNDSRLTTTTSEIQSIIKEEDVKSLLLLSNIQSNSAPGTNNASHVSQASQMGLINTSKEGVELEEKVKRKRGRNLQRQKNTNNVQTIIEQVSQVIPQPPSSCSSLCSPSQNNHVNESQSISLDDAISLMSLPQAEEKQMIYRKPHCLVVIEY